ncbi:choline O-acetyltransferase-like [Branchiostoma floridae]|uniref:Choline O-acetyltransferase n=1 Tax=Branchiostoma floridae TaxID=7739 RepID=A0A9J7MKW3_BRAFL|nr:choline O-acetyltransferase-like [Branchiostoma floridae]XP_035671418.1 choline O-acetyltransferase-like [Branchiostoma floridae]
MSQMPDVNMTRMKRQGSEDVVPCPTTQALPKLPVPPLQQTLEGYLKVVRPLVSDDEYEQTKRKVEEFGKPGGDGEMLQEKLLEYAQTKVNWVYDWWMDDMYLTARLPLVINSSPGMVFPKQIFTEPSDQLRFAARLISGIMDYKVILDARALPIDYARGQLAGQPLCMEQYYRLFSSYRVPGLTRDMLVSPDSSVMPEPEHIIVVCKNQFFVLDVIINFKRLSEADLFNQLKRIMQAATAGDRCEPVGLLTAGDRTEWAKARIKLMEDSTNRDSLDMIERCIFVLCMDEGVCCDKTDLTLACQMLHGNGSHSNTPNRWFDKTMQFIVADDGACGLVYEHSPSEGVAVVQLVEHLLNYIRVNPWNDVCQRDSPAIPHACHSSQKYGSKKMLRAQSICELPYPRRLRWKLSPEVFHYLKTSRESVDRSIANMDLHIMRYTRFGKSFPKSQNMSPDGFVQLALQLTYFKLHKRLVSTYESASTRRFQLGRVDNIRAASIEAHNWVRAMCSDTVEDYDRMELFKKALKAQRNFTLQALKGQGIDCHLLGLKEMAAMIDMPMPDIFTDEPFDLTNKFVLSTSQVPTTMDAFMCYGPVVNNGYGACYNPHDDYILFCLSSFKDCGDSDSEMFTIALRQALDDMQHLCLKVNHPPSPVMDLRKVDINGDSKMANGLDGHQLGLPMFPCGMARENNPTRKQNSRDDDDTARGPIADGAMAQT